MEEGATKTQITTIKGSQAMHRCESEMSMIWKEIPNNNNYLREGSKSHTPKSYREQTRGVNKFQGRTPPRPIWMAKTREMDQLRSPVRQIRDLSESSRTPRPHREPIDETHKQPTELPRKALETAMGEVREVMVQYANCADPVESAARRERTRLSEAAGEVQETAENMVRSTMITYNTVEEEEPEATFRLQDRIPATLRLGPIYETLPVEILDPTTKPPARKRLERPPGTKKTSFSPSVLQGASSKKRKYIQARGSPRRRTQAKQGTCNEREGKTTYHTGGTSMAVIERGTHTQADQPPHCNILSLGQKTI
ncbi:unnamed protein product [Arabis nemorensis]|uniref:Uncharacterized protein n=1 Tax=Arabis nemorensis TaxID=586526 RepID=A0A565ALJ7_9BRAS|nr:unnamed protein product [Arabis nemorensis]